jgi:hypothetical protein
MAMIVVGVTMFFLFMIMVIFVVVGVTVFSFIMNMEQVGFNKESHT